MFSGPGSGKGTQCAKLLQEYGYVHLSAGDLLRAERDSGSEHGELINNIIKEGKIVPVAITCGLIKDAMEKQGWEQKKYLVDGFPRNEDNYQGWMEVMGDIVDVPFVFWFDVSEEELEKRILERSKTSGRNDDNVETLRKRFAQFNSEQIGIINKYMEKGLVRKINGNQDVDAVYGDVKTALTGYL